MCANDAYRKSVQLIHSLDIVTTYSSLLFSGERFVCCIKVRYKATAPALPSFVVVVAVTASIQSKFYSRRRMKVFSGGC